MNLSLSITTHNRVDLTMKSFEKVYDDDRIDDIVIVDDFSKGYITMELSNRLSLFSKVRYFANGENIGMSQNKAKAISLARNEWVLILDSDNVIDSTYLDAFFKIGSYQRESFYCPSFARPNFDYRKYEGQSFNAISIKPKMKEGEMQCLLNTSNYVVNRDWFANVYRHNPLVKETDTHWVNYLNLDKGGSLVVVPDMYYDHLVHKDSGWMRNANYNMKKAEEINRLIEKI